MRLAAGVRAKTLRKERRGARMRERPTWIGGLYATAQPQAWGARRNKVARGWALAPPERLWVALRRAQDSGRAVPTEPADPAGVARQLCVVSVTLGFLPLARAGF